MGTRDHGWFSVPGITAKDITQAWNSQTGKRYVYATATDGGIYSLNANQTGWVWMQGIAKAIDAGYDGSVWSIGNDGKIYELVDSAGWVNRNFNVVGGQDIGLDGQNCVYMCDMTNKFYQLNSARNGWNVVNCGFSVKRVDVDQDFVYALSINGTVYQCKRGTNTWTALSGIAAQEIGCSSYR